jgi:hypothetical protein
MHLRKWPQSCVTHITWLIQRKEEERFIQVYSIYMQVYIQDQGINAATVTVTVTGNLLNTKVLTLVSRLLRKPVQSPSDMRYRPPGTRQSP